MALKHFLAGTTPEEAYKQRTKLENSFSEEDLQKRKKGIELFNQAKELEGQGSPEERIRLFAEARELLIQARDPLLFIPTDIIIAQIVADELGRPDEALSLLQYALEFCRDMKMAEDEIDILLNMAECHIYAGKFAEAKECFDCAHSVALRTNDRRLLQEVIYESEVLKRDYLVSVHSGKIYPIKKL